MLDKNARIDQVIYAAGGNVDGRENHGDFGIKASSMKVDVNFRDVLTNMVGAVKDYNTSKLTQQTSPDIRLKEGAKKNIFGKYKDSDYITEEIVTRNEIVILEESNPGALTDAPGVDSDSDFRDNPEDAPYKIAAMKLLDGRLVVTRVAHIGKVYSDIDLRSGNFVFHSLIFPEGTEIEDIKGMELPFQKDLMEHNGKKNMNKILIII